MKVLITDAFCSSNRGDAAILDSILTGLGRRLPDATFTVASRFPAVCRHFHRVDAIDDADPVALALAISESDLVVSCGGSFLHELYAPNLHPRLATLALARRAEVPVVVFAQSIGPLDTPLSRTAAREALDGATWVVARDAASLVTARRLGVRTPCDLGVDAALVGTVTPQPRGTDGPLLGVTVRDWHFPGLDAAERQAAYEAEVARACDAWVDATGGLVRFLSNCTSFGGYARDDRAPARRVAARMRHAAEVVDADDLPFDVVRGQAAACDLLVGTRMHSLIFASTAGVPVVGVAYEEKTGEWLRRIGLDGQHVPIEDASGLTGLLLRAWADRDATRATLARTLPPLFATAEAQLDRLAGIPHGQLPASAEPLDVPAGDWDRETWRYDVAHRRLRCVADLLLAEAGPRVLDVGCSTGMLGRMLGPTYDYTGVDVAPSVAATEPRFRVLTADLNEGPLPVDGPFDAIACSGGLEYLDDLGAALTQLRARLASGGLAVVTLHNLAHVAYALGHAHRHPAWRYTARPDDLALCLHEVGLVPVRVLASSAGYAPAPAVDREGPTDHDRDGGGQLPPERLIRVAHHVVFVCRAVDPAPGPMAVEALAATDPAAAIHAAMALAKRYPWSARAWSDLGVLMHATGSTPQARTCLTRAWQLDPSRPDIQDNAAALGLTYDDLVPTTGFAGAELGLLAQPDDPAAWDRLIAALVDVGRLHAAAAVQGLGARRQIGRRASLRT